MSHQWCQYSHRERLTSGEVWRTSEEPLACSQNPESENFLGSGRGTSGKFGEKSRKILHGFGKSDSLPAKH